MSWFGKLKRPTPQQELEAAAAAASVTNAKVYVEHADRTCELRGEIHGFQLRVRVDADDDEDEGVKVRDFEVRHAEDGSIEYIDLEWDPDVDAKAEHPPAWKESDRRVYLADRVWVEGSRADAEAARFRALPAALQQRVLDAMPAFGLMYFRSRDESVEITTRSIGRRRPDGWLGQLIALAGAVAAARGARPVGAMPASVERELGDANAFARKLAVAVSHRASGAKVVSRGDEQKIEVRWTAHGVPVRVVLDHRRHLVHVEALAAHAQAVRFTLEDGETYPETAPPDDPWDLEVAQRAAFSRVERGAREAILAAMASHTVEELAVAGGLVTTEWAAFEDFLDDDDNDTAAVNAAALGEAIARFAAALPRG